MENWLFSHQLPANKWFNLPNPMYKRCWYTPVILLQQTNVPVVVLCMGKFSFPSYLTLAHPSCVHCKSSCTCTPTHVVLHPCDGTTTWTPSRSQFCADSHNGRKNREKNLVCTKKSSKGWKTVLWREQPEKNQVVGSSALLSLPTHFLGGNEICCLFSCHNMNWPKKMVIKRAVKIALRTLPGRAMPNMAFYFDIARSVGSSLKKVNSKFHNYHVLLPLHNLLCISQHTKVAQTVWWRVCLVDNADQHTQLTWDTHQTLAK